MGEKEKSIVGRVICRLLEIRYYLVRGYDDNANLEEGNMSVNIYEEMDKIDIPLAYTNPVAIDFLK